MGVNGFQPAKRACEDSSGEGRAAAARRADVMETTCDWLRKVSTVAF